MPPIDEADIRLVAQMAEYSRNLYLESSPAHVDALDRVLATLGEPVPFRTPIGFSVSFPTMQAKEQTP